MRAHVSRGRTLRVPAHVRIMWVVTQPQTAGDVLRLAAAEGAKTRGIARRLAGDGAEHREVERWRFVVDRAVRFGSEPDQRQAQRIATVFGVALRQPDAPTPDRLAALEARVADLTEALEVAKKANDRLRGRVLTLERHTGLRPPVDQEAPATGRAVGGS